MPGLLDCATTTAPAPSAKIVDVFLSPGSTNFVIAYAPITSTRLYRSSARMYFHAVSNAVTKPAHALLMSNAPAFHAPILACTTGAVAGEMYSGVSVARII